MADRPVLNLIILSAALAGMTMLIMLPPIPQAAGYHQYADARSFLGVPNFLNVITNLPFFWLGWRGLTDLGRRGLPGALPGLDGPYAVFFIGALLVGLGSGYYHWHPTNAALVWDRLPLTLIFMAFFAVIVGETLDADVARRSFPLLAALGLASVLYWYWSERQGHGDLRFYGLVQFLPMALTPMMLIFGRSCFSRNYYIWGVLAAYGAAKLAEYGDKAVFAVTGGVISGHSVKHLLAAAGVWLFLIGLRRRKRIDFSAGR